MVNVLKEACPNTILNVLRDKKFFVEKPQKNQDLQQNRLKKDMHSPRNYQESL